MMPIMNAAPIFYITSDLYQAGRQEDGVPFIAEVYFVQAEFADGRRLDHQARFPGCKVEHDEEGCPHFADTRDDAQLAAGRLLDRILQAEGAMNPAYWREGRPVYGSAAYDPREELALEAREREDECFA